MRKCSTASDFVFILDFGNRHTKNFCLKQYLHRFDRFECYCYYTKLFIMAAELEWNSLMRTHPQLSTLSLGYLVQILCKINVNARNVELKSLFMFLKLNWTEGFNVAGNEFSTIVHLSLINDIAHTVHTANTHTHILSQHWKKKWAVTGVEKCTNRDSLVERNSKCDDSCHISTSKLIK